jgi:enoyl-CoA hydratase/carnithine racemase
MSGAASIGLSIDGPIATVRIDNPPLNILTIALREALFSQVAEIEGRPDIRVVIVEGVGARAFSVGSDINEFPQDELGGVAKIRFEQYLLDRLAALPAITIAKVDGMALGGGAELMLACDFRIASTAARIGFPEIRLGALPAAGGMKRLVREIGPLRTRELVLLGRPIDASRAAELGLVNMVVPPDDLYGAVANLASDLAELPGKALCLAKQTIASASSSGEMDTAEAEAFGALFRGSDIAEGLAAFLAKRKPSFNASA